MRNLYFYDKQRATIKLVDGRLRVDGSKNDQEMVYGYRPQFANDTELYNALPQIFRGYWHVGDETDREIKKRG